LRGCLHSAVCGSIHLGVNVRRTRLFCLPLRVRRVFARQMDVGASHVRPLRASYDSWMFTQSPLISMNTTITDAVSGSCQNSTRPDPFFLLGAFVSLPRWVNDSSLQYLKTGHANASCEHSSLQRQRCLLIIRVKLLLVVLVLFWSRHSAEGLLLMARPRLVFPHMREALHIVRMRTF